jgi:two-component system NtrC family response regulator
MRVGGERPIKTDVRVIAATNVDLEEAIREKTFREDLFYRLNVVRLEIPPLQQRREDIPMLAEHFAHLFNPSVRIAPEVLTLLQRYHWPGNIRELANVVRRAMVMCTDDTILPGHLNSRFLTAAVATESAAPPDFFGAADFLRACELWQEQAHHTPLLAQLSPQELDRLQNALHNIAGAVRAVLPANGTVAVTEQGLKETEAETIKKSLALHQWNITVTARALGIGRNTLYRKIKEFNFTP